MSGSAADLVVVGAGPAGCAAAITAARRGLHVILLDKARFPRDKTCGDGLTAAALHHLERLGVNAPSLPGYHRVTRTVVVSPSGRRIDLPLPPDGHHAAVVRRVELDEALVLRARACGVDVREDEPVIDVRQDHDGVTLTTASQSTTRSPFVIAADGHWSPVRKLLEPSDAVSTPLGEWHAARQYLDNVDDDRLWVLFEADLLPGYAWVFPLPGGGANVGFAVLREGRKGAELKALWNSLLERSSLRSAIGPHGEPSGPMRAWPIPASYRPACLTNGRVLFAGDCAGVVDPMTGEGIAQALESATLAAESIVAGGDVACVTRRYRTDVDSALGADLRFGRALQRVLRHRVGAEAGLRVIDLTGWTRRNFARWMWEDYPRAVALTPRRWSRGVLSPAGAFVSAPRGGQPRADDAPDRRGAARSSPEPRGAASGTTRP